MDLLNVKGSAAFLQNLKQKNKLFGETPSAFKDASKGSANRSGKQQNVINV